MVAAKLFVGAVLKGKCDVFWLLQICAADFILIVSAWMVKFFWVALSLSPYSEDHHNYCQDLKSHAAVICVFISQKIHIIPMDDIS
jgi:hypothetical protein